VSLSPKRKGRLTASVFSSAIGINPYQSRQALYRQIKGIDEPFTGNEATQYGNDNEQNAIDAYELDQNVIVTKSGEHQEFIIDNAFDWLGCTPDGFTADRLVEAKCPFYKMYDDVPAHYMAQVQGQMFIAEMDQCDFFAWSPEEIRIWRVDFSEAYWAMMLPLLCNFWESVKNETEPKRRKKPVMPEVHYELLI